MEHSAKLSWILERIKIRDPRGLAKAITWVENLDEGAAELMSYAYRHMHDRALVIGITGPGGAGKSTLIDKVIRQLRLGGKKVGVIAVDPSSPYTGGAFLGDRVRMGNHNVDPSVYIRSFASRGSMGGISRATKHCLYLFKNYDFDYIIVESLGIGQDETEITNFVDVTVVTVVPGYGDNIQIAKAGMQEIADIFVINKADKPDAEEFYHQMLDSLQTIPEELRPLVMKTVALNNVGVPELVEAVKEVGTGRLGKRPERDRLRIKAEIEMEVAALVRLEIRELVEQRAEAVFQGQTTPFETSTQIVEQIFARQS